MKRLRNQIRGWPNWAGAWRTLRRSWPVLALLLGAVLWPAVLREQVGPVAALVWLAVFLLAAALARGESAWGEAGRSFMGSQLGRQLHALCRAVLPWLLQVGPAASALCTALTALVGELAQAFYARWLAPAKAA